MRAVIRFLRPGEYKRTETDDLLHQVRTQTQVSMLQTHLRRRPPADRPSIADALKPPAHDKERP